MILSLLLTAAPIPVVSPVPANVRTAFSLSPRYVKVVMAKDFPILGSAKVSDAALREARGIVLAMTENHPEYLDALAKAKIRLVVMAPTELTTDVPEHSDLSPKSYWDRRARGLGATSARPAISCAEENLIDEPGDPYATESICVHEFAHTLHELAIATLDPSFQPALEAAYARALAHDTWKNTYAATNVHEYWAEAVQSWFDTNRHDDAEHGSIDTRDEVRTADPAVAALIERALGPLEWKFQKYSSRSVAQRGELGDRPSPLPTFAWPKDLETPQPDRPVALERGALALSQSPRSTDAATLIVQNRSASALELRWLNFEDTLVKYATVAPRGTTEQPTFGGHVWVVTRDGVRLGWIAAKKGRTTVTIDDDRAGPISLDTGPLTIARSPKSTTEVTLEVENHERAPIEWNWLTFDGALQRYATIDAGGSLSQPTYAGHVWVVTRQGMQLGWFAAPQLGGRVVIGEAPSAVLISRPLTLTSSPSISERPVTLTVENRGARPIEWSWLGFDGSLRQYAIIAAGASLAQPTYEGHVWVVSRKGARVGWFVAPGQKTRLVVR